jgi:F-type H+-transporting ATPase subunit b
VNFNATIIGQTIAFFVFVWFCYKFVWPPIIAAMAARQQRIEEGLEAANRADKDLELAHKKVAEQLKEAKEQAAKIVDQANKRAAQVIDEAKEQAVVEADRIKVAAQAEVERQVSQAREALRGRVAELALEGASKVLESSVDASAHSAMLDKLSAEL